MTKVWPLAKQRHKPERLAARPATPILMPGRSRSDDTNLNLGRSYSDINLKLAALVATPTRSLAAPVAAPI